MNIMQKTYKLRKSVDETLEELTNIQLLLNRSKKRGITEEMKNWYQRKIPELINELIVPEIEVNDNPTQFFQCGG